MVENVNYVKFQDLAFQFSLKATCWGQLKFLKNGFHDDD